MKTDVSEWYNEFSTKQVKTGINLRHFTIMNEVIKTGLKKNHTVLEIGCGVGTVTTLLNQYLKRGKLVATDISDESIEIAKQHIKNSDRIEFRVTDMSDFTYPEKFDFVILPDVLEHIPIEQHRNLFARIAEHMHDNSIIFINIPHPKALDYIRKHYPDKLQIIDQSISADSLMKDAYENGLVLCNYISYSLFDHETDAAIVTFKKNSWLTLRPLTKWQIIRKKLAARTRFMKSTF